VGFSGSTAVALASSNCICNKSGMKEPREHKAIVEEIAAGCLVGRARMLSRALTSLYEEELRAFGVKASQINLLVIVAKAGPVRRGHLPRYINLEPSTLTRALSVLLARGLVRESDGGAAGRNAPVEITDAGLALLADMGPGWRRAQAKAEALLGAEMAARMRGLSPTLSLPEPA
jgi:DNA-binding MarR family transcriptional regulator